MTSPKIRTLLAAAALTTLAASLPAYAAEPLFKAGLWEITSKPGGANGGQMQAMMAAAQQHLKSMAPADRARAEAMMARNGVVIENGSMSAKVCISKAMAQRQQLPMQQRGSCSYQTSPPAGNTISFTMSCTNPTITSEGSAVFSDSTHYTATSRTSGGMGGPAGAAQTASMSLESSGHWLSADCGSIAPANSGK